MSLGRRVTFLLVLAMAVSALPVTPSAGGQSSSQETCTEAPRNPVLNDSVGFNTTYPTGIWFAYNDTHQEPTVVRTAIGFRMWYAGSVAGLWGIYTATSKDGGNWTVYPTPVLTSGPSGTWDSAPLMAPSVLYNGTGYMMYFRSSPFNIYSRSIGLAFSADGVHWTEYAENPVLRPGPGFYDSNWIYNANVVVRNGTYYMWYTGSAPHPNATAQVWYYGAIDLATSPDGMHWTKYPGNPVFIGAPDQLLLGTTTVGHPDVLEVNGTLLMLYGDGYGVRYAVSSDGIHWTPSARYLVDVAGGFWESSYVSEPAALLNGTELTLWYFGSSPTAHSWSSYVAGIGLAYCNFVTVQTTTTRTVVTTSILVQTAISVSTTVFTVVSTTTVEQASPLLPVLGGTTAVGLALVAALAYLLIRRGPQRTL